MPVALRRLIAAGGAATLQPRAHRGGRDRSGGAAAGVAHRLSAWQRAAAVHAERQRARRRAAWKARTRKI